MMKHIIFIVLSLLAFYLFGETAVNVYLQASEGGITSDEMTSLLAYVGFCAVGMVFFPLCYWRFALSAPSNSQTTKRDALRNFGTEKPQHVWVLACTIIFLWAAGLFGTWKIYAPFLANSITVEGEVVEHHRVKRGDIYRFEAELQGGLVRDTRRIAVWRGALAEGERIRLMVAEQDGVTRLMPEMVIKNGYRRIAILLALPTLVLLAPLVLGLRNIITTRRRTNVISRCK